MKLLRYIQCILLRRHVEKVFDFLEYKEVKRHYVGVVAGLSLRPEVGYRVEMECPHCGHHVMSLTRYTRDSPGYERGKNDWPLNPDGSRMKMDVS